MNTRNKFSGVVEGFYGKPYTFAERHDLIGFLDACALNTYVYAPKADPYHRKQWFLPYPVAAMHQFEKLVRLCDRCAIHFNYALSPMVHPDIMKIIQKVKKMMKIGIRHFSLLYDDIPVPLSRETASEHAHSANELWQFLRSTVEHPVLFFCPTQYRGMNATEYLATIVEKLDHDIHIFWTGNHVVSRAITARDIRKVTTLLKRKPLIWDNLFANDYIPGTILRLPYRNRSRTMVRTTVGILINPMNQYEQSKPLIHTAAQFINDPERYVPHRAWKRAQAHCRHNAHR
ncbi:hypothetical protein AMJ87_08345 [candidate division WOR_3 bacterium SM23_60]|uniref:GH84 domain-containing protein n=1 Tax=candidate division WOR_3 bacterium SM23_60 TaxID=1703780 RepID=A0A0S8GCM0_UNCW3|nr:MAG: hypothetical protein AMJ87_08345 [candidate division WOR_3 bacterium SM23_60]